LVIIALALGAGFVAATISSVTTYAAEGTNP
jgi:hypothetical protein